MIKIVVLSKSAFPVIHALFVAVTGSVQITSCFCRSARLYPMVMESVTTLRKGRSVNSNPETNPGHFAAYLQRSLDEMQLLVTTARL